MANPRGRTRRHHVLLRGLVHVREQSVEIHSANQAGLQNQAGTVPDAFAVGRLQSVPIRIGDPNMCHAEPQIVGHPRQDIRDAISVLCAEHAQTLSGINVEPTFMFQSQERTGNQRLQAAMLAYPRAAPRVPRPRTPYPDGMSFGGIPLLGH